MKLWRALLEAGLVALGAWTLLRLGFAFLSGYSVRYRPTAARQLRRLAWPLLALGAGLGAAGPGLLAARPAERALAAGVLVLTLAAVAPALWLHLRYYALNAATTLVFDPRRGRLQVWLGGELAYDAGRQGWPGPGPVRWVRCRWPGAFWQGYEYLRLPLPQGDLYLTTLLLSDLAPLVQYLRHFGVVVEEERRGWARV